MDENTKDSIRQHRLEKAQPKRLSKDGKTSELTPVTAAYEVWLSNYELPKIPMDDMETWLLLRLAEVQSLSAQWEEEFTQGKRPSLCSTCTRNKSSLAGDTGEYCNGQSAKSCRFYQPHKD